MLRGFCDSGAARVLPIKRREVSSKFYQIHVSFLSYICTDMGLVNHM